VVKALRSSQLAATAAGAAVLSLWARALIQQAPNYNYADTFGPTLVELGELTLVPSSAVTWFYGGAQMVLPRLIGIACRTLQVTPEFMHTAITVVTLVVGLGGLGAAASRIAGSRWAASLTIIAIPFAWPFALNVGYSAPFWTGYHVAGYWGLGWTCAVWGVWFRSPARGRLAAVPFALAGLEFLAHPTWAIVALTVLGLGELIEIAVAADRGAALRAAAARIAVALLIASPQVVLIVANLRQPVAAADLAGWWPLIQFRKSFHFYLWDDFIAYARFGLLALLMMLATTVVWPSLDAVSRRRAIATSLAVAVLLLTAYLVMEVVPIRALSSLVLTRAGALLSAVSIVFIVAATVASGIASRVTAVALWVALLAVAIPIDGTPYSTVAQRFSAMMPVVVRATGNFSLSLVVTALAVVVGVAFRRKAVPVQPSRILPIVAAIVIAVLTVAKLPLVPRAQAPSSATWDALTTYLREQTPRDSLVMMPPYPYSIASARRSFVQDYSLLAAAVYNPPMTPFELDVLRNVYEVDIDGLSHDQIKELLAKNGGILCFLERKYRALVASEARMRAVKTAYPSLSFVVGFKPGVTPLEWTCGAYDGAVLPLPIAYENAEYVLYDVRDLNPAAADR
jgi:hypothetical protein